MIVVAIIAVLVAIAVPLFVGELGDAEKSVKDANIRTVRSEATIYLLKAEATDATTDTTGANRKSGPIFDKDGNFNKDIKVTAKVGNTGKIEQLEFTQPTEGEEKTDTCEKDGDSYKVTVYIDTEAAMKGVDPAAKG